MIKLVIFDWDDVFTLGSTAGYRKCYHEAVVGVGVHLDAQIEKERIDSKWGSTHILEIQALLKENPELVEDAIALYEKHLFGETFVNSLSLVHGSIELLNRLNKKYKLALATGVHPELLKDVIMPRFNIPDVFSKIITGYDLEDSSLTKPHPRSAEIIIDELEVTPEETVTVGDAENDMKMAEAAKTHRVAVLTGHLNREQAINLGVENIVEDVTKIEHILEKL